MLELAKILVIITVFHIFKKLRDENIKKAQT